MREQDISINDIGGIFLCPYRKHLINNHPKIHVQAFCYHQDGPRVR